MGKILAGMATSHAFALVDPSEWDQHREANREGFFRRYNYYPPVHPNIDKEDDHSVRERYGRVERALGRLGDQVQTLDPSALVIIGDDQNENFTEDCVPQFAIFIGDEIETQVYHGPAADAHPMRVVPYHRPLAEAILEYGVEQGFDVAVARRLRYARGLGHAFGPPLRYLNPELRVPIVCIAVNAIHPPAPSPRRCLELGRMLRQAVAGTNEKVIVYGSGGLSHFTAGFPYATLGRFCYGEIDSDFDRQLLAALTRGDESFLGSLSSRDLLEHGDIEFRSWLVVQGAMDGASAEALAYEPFYRGIMGMGCALWPAPGGHQAMGPAEA